MDLATPSKTAAPRVHTLNERYAVDTKQRQAIKKWLAPTDDDVQP